MGSPTKEYNLRYLKKSRLKSGDIFAMLIGDEYIFGRIIRGNLPFDESPFAGSNLIYVYNIRSSSKAVDYSKLTPDNLLIPPMYISNALWSRGYAVKVANRDISEEDLLRHHCFYSPSHNTYFDEKGIELTEKTKPCGEWVCVVGIDYIDNKISDALGIKRAPLTETEMFYVSGRGEKILLKKTDSELRRYSNYQWIIDNHPEIIEK